MLNTSWPLQFSDDFNGSALNLSNWRNEVLPAGTFNHELQRYTNNSAKVRDGQLVLTAKRDGSDKYVSTRLSSVFTFTYGMVEMRGKVPYDHAIWPAFWMVGTGSWPLTGEVDILEVFGHKFGKAACVSFHMMAHHWPSDSGQCKTLPDLSPTAGEGDWHVWRLFWTPTRLSVTLDAADPHDPADERVTCYDKADTDGSVDEWPFFGPQQMLLNIAVGGNGVGMAHPSHSWESSSLEIDYVRVYELPDEFVDTSYCPPKVRIATLVDVSVGAAVALVLVAVAGWRCHRRRAARECAADTLYHRLLSPIRGRPEHARQLGTCQDQPALITASPAAPTDCAPVGV